MTKPRGPLPELTESQTSTWLDTNKYAYAAFVAARLDLLHELAASGWSHRMLAQLYGVTHNTIRYWMRPPRSTDATP